MQLTIEIEVQDCDSSDINVTNQCENLTLEIIDAPVSDSVSIDDDAGIGDTDVTWSADKSARELADKVDAVAGMGLSELSFTTVDKLSLDQSEQDRHTHNNKTVIDDLSDDAGVLQYKGLPISDQAALDAKVDKVAGYSLVDDAEIAKLLTVQADATKNSTDAELRDRATHTGEQAIATVMGLQGALDSKVDKESGKSLISDLEIAKLATVQENATANRADSLNADKIHDHTVSQVVGLSDRLDSIDSLIGDVESVLIAINGEPTP